MEDELLGRQSTFDEARELYQMLDGDVNTVEALRKLIAVSPKIERMLWVLPCEICDEGGCAFRGSELLFAHST